MVLNLKDVSLTTVDHIRPEDMTKHLIVTVSHLLGHAEEVVLAHIVLGEEEPIIWVLRLLERVLLREQVALQLSELALLRGVLHRLDHQGNLRWVCPQFPLHLVLVDESEFRACLIHEDLLDHAVGLSGVADDADEC